MPRYEANLHFLLNTISECPNANAIRECPLTSYRQLDVQAQNEALSKLSQEERQSLVRHCKYCVRFYGLAQQL